MTQPNSIIICIVCVCQHVVGGYNFSSGMQCFFFVFFLQLPDFLRSYYRSRSFSVHLLPGCFSVQNVVPQPDGDSSKVKVKVRVNIHGIFSVSSASLIEKQKGEGEEMQTDSEPMVQNEGRGEEQVPHTSTSQCVCATPSKSTPPLLDRLCYHH